MSLRVTVLLLALGFAIMGRAQQESPPNSPEAPAKRRQAESEIIKLEINPDSPIRTTMMLTRLGGIAGLHEELTITPSGKVSGVWMGKTYDGEIDAGRIEKVGTALDASGLFKKRSMPSAPVGSDLIWVSIRYEGVLAMWNEYLAPEEAEKLLAEMTAVLEALPPSSRKDR